MITFGIIKRMVKSFLAEVSGIGGTTQKRFISPKGIYSKPKDNNSIVFELSEGTNQDIVIAVQKEIELQDGDVILTDDKNYIHFKYKDGVIEIKGDTKFENNVIIAGNLTVEGNIEAVGTVKGAIGEFQTSLKVGTSELLAHVHGGVTSGSSSTAPLV